MLGRGGEIVDSLQMLLDEVFLALLFRGLGRQYVDHTLSLMVILFVYLAGVLCCCYSSGLWSTKLIRKGLYRSKGESTLAKRLEDVVRRRHNVLVLEGKSEGI